jgi:hypothetical protein
MEVRGGLLERQFNRRRLIAGQARSHATCETAMLAGILMQVIRDTFHLRAP